MQRIYKPIVKIARLLWAHRLRVLAGMGVVAVVAMAGLAVYRTQRPLKIALADRKSVQVSGPLKVDFGQDIAAGFTASIEPKVAGTWQNERTVLGVSAVSFKPAKRFEAGRSYKLRITNVKRAVTGASLPDIRETFDAQVPAAVKTASPKTDSKDVPVRPRLTVTLIEANQGVRDLKPALTPAVALRQVSSDDKTFVWEPVTPLKQGEAYTFTLDDARMPTPEKQRMFTAVFTTVMQPAIASARTGGYFSPGQNVDIVFGQPMDVSSEAFTFDFAGKGSWVDDHTYRYVPVAEKLKPGATYKYRVKAGLKSVVGGVLEAERPFEFATNGAVTAAVSPGGGSIALNAPIRVAFDQAVDHASAQTHFSVNPGLAGNFTWSGNTMTYVSSGFAYQTGYSFQVAPGVAPAWGLPSARAFGGSFTTLAETIKLGVPGYKTQYRMSCELASMRMLLGFRGINVSDWDILMKIGYNPRSRDKATNSWDDPNVTYVGDLGGYPNSTGYGVHAGPIAAAARSYGRDATAYFNVSAAFISGQIHAGNPVEFWGHSTPSKPDSWNVPGGSVQTWLSSHARVVFGVVGSAEAPQGFWIIESMTGKPFYWSTAQLMANMNVVPGVSNQAVVVR